MPKPKAPTPSKIEGGKRGPRSDRETELLYEYMSEGKKIDEICRLLNRNVSTVKKWLDDLHIEQMGANSFDVKRIVGDLHKRHFWQEVCQQFTQEELKYFEGEWLSLMLQFREDVLAAEVLSLKQLVTINILINRSMKERKKHIEEIDKLQTEINKEYALGDMKDGDKLANLENQVSYARSALGQYTTEYTKLLDQQKNITKDMKATRDQRIKRVEDSKSSWAGLIRLLEEDDHRQKMGYDAEIMKIAKDRAKEQLGNYVTYDNGQIDRPLLTPETVIEE